MLASRATASASFTISAAARAMRASPRLPGASADRSRLRLTVLERPGTAADPRYEPLARELPEIARTVTSKRQTSAKVPQPERNRVSPTGAARVASALVCERFVRSTTSSMERQYVRRLWKSIPVFDFRIRPYRKRTRNSRKDQADSLHGRTRGAHEARRLQIETPSWGYGNSGTRFHVYPWPGAARTVQERIADAALVHRLTGCCPSVALHIPWDAVDDYAALRRYAEAEGVTLGAINPNLFGSDEYRLGASATRKRACAPRALDHCRECVEIAERAGSSTISLWLADGTNYPGQDDLGSRFARLVEGLERLYAELSDDLTAPRRVKFFEPGFYSTDLPDWGTAALVCRRLGPRAKVLVDTGHHPPGRTSSRSSRCSCPRGSSAASTSTTGSTPTTT